MRIFVDTNVIIDYTKGFKEILKVLLEKQDEGQLEIYVNPIVISEFFNDKNLKNKKRLETALELFENFKVLDIDKRIGLLSGKLLRTNKVNFLADALIAATCLQHDLLLVTSNKGDFRKVEEMKFY